MPHMPTPRNHQRLNQPAKPQSATADTLQRTTLRATFTATLLGCLLVCLLVSLPGCVERTISVTSEPAGALVYLNEQEVGRTPVRVPFTFYGTYSVRLQRDDYVTLNTTHKAKAPWWEAPGPDLIGELIPNNKVELAWHFDLEKAVASDPDQVIDRASQLRTLLQEESPELNTAVVTPDQPSVASPEGESENTSSDTKDQ